LRLQQQVGDRERGLVEVDELEAVHVQALHQPTTTERMDLLEPQAFDGALRAVPSCVQVLHPQAVELTGYEVEPAVRREEAQRAPRELGRERQVRRQEHERLVEGEHGRQYLIGGRRQAEGARQMLEPVDVSIA
jgi:PAS domain-containing protein